MTSSLAAPSVLLRGEQQPRISSIPSYASSSGEEAIKLARLAGIELDPWQQMELTHALGESPDWKCPYCTYRVADPVPCPQHPRAELLHPWAAFEVGEVVPRQNGKSELLIARQLAGLFILEEELQIYSAHLFDTAMEVFRRLVFLVENCDDLRREVKHRGSKLVGIKYSHGEEGVELASGLRIRFKARTAGGGRGFSCDGLQLDEAMILPEGFLAATVPTLSARPNPQIWFAGSAVDEEDPAHDGIVLAKRRARALKGDDPSLCYFEHSAEGDHPTKVGPEVLDDPEEWARSNPGLGIRITSEYVANERRAMGSRQFAVERLGIGAWPDISEDAGRVISTAQWAACAEHDRANRITSTPSFAIDCNPSQTQASIAVAGRRADERIQGAIVAYDEGTGWIVARCLELRAQERKARFAVDKNGPAADLIQDLQDAGITVDEVDASTYRIACGTFLNAVNNDRFRYPHPQPELDEALAGARKGQSGDAWKWSRKLSAVDAGTDISPLVALTLAFAAADIKKRRARVINLADL